MEQKKVTVRIRNVYQRKIHVIYQWTEFLLMILTLL